MLNCGSPSGVPSPDRIVTVRADVLGTLFVVWGALMTLLGASLFSLGIGAFALVGSAPGSSGQLSASLAAGVFTTLAVLACLWGAAHIAVGLPLRRCRHWSRIAAMILGGIDLVILPYGTALGCYALVTLLREDARRLFDAPASDPTTSTS